MNICKQCGAPIEWIKKGAALVPVDETPVFIAEGSGTERFLTDEGRIVTGYTINCDEMGTDPTVAFVPHRRTCSHAAGFWREPVKPP